MCCLVDEIGTQYTPDPDQITIVEAGFISHREVVACPQILVKIDFGGEYIGELDGNLVRNIRGIGCAKKRAGYVRCPDFYPCLQGQGGLVRFIPISGLLYHQITRGVDLELQIDQLSVGSRF